MKKRDLERHCADHGCRRGRQGARHEIWENPETGKWAAVPRHREIKTHTARGICRQLGIPAPPAFDVLGKLGPEIGPEIPTS